MQGHNKPTQKVNRQNARPSVNANSQKRVAVRARSGVAQPQVQQKPTQFRTNLTSQTPTQRQSQRSSKKITGSVKNMEVHSHQRSAKKTYIIPKKKKKFDFAAFGIKIGIVVVLAGIIFGLVALAFNSKVKSSSTKVPDYTIAVGNKDYNDYFSYTSDGEICGANGSLYVNIDVLRDFCDFTVTGDNTALRYIPRNSENQSVTFNIGSNLAKINGVTVRLDAPAFTYGGGLYIPVSFFENYVNYLEVSTDTSSKTISIAREPEYASEIVGTNDNISYIPLTFKLGESGTISNISEESINES